MTFVHKALSLVGGKEEDAKLRPPLLDFYQIKGESREAFAEKQMFHCKHQQFQQFQINWYTFRTCQRTTLIAATNYQQTSTLF